MLTHIKNELARRVNQQYGWALPFSKFMEMSKWLRKAISTFYQLGKGADR